MGGGDNLIGDLEVDGNGSGVSTQSVTTRYADPFLRSNPLLPFMMGS